MNYMSINTIIMSESIYDPIIIILFFSNRIIWLIDLSFDGVSIEMETDRQKERTKERKKEVDDVCEKRKTSEANEIINLRHL